MVRVDGDAARALQAVRTAIARAEPSLAVHGERGMEAIVEENLAGERTGMTVLLLFAVFGVVLSGIGIYGLVSYFVGDRTREIGIRLALGAQRSAVVHFVLRQAVLPVLAGTAAGLAGSVMFHRVLDSILPGLGPVQVAVTIAGAAFLAGIAVWRRRCPRSVHREPNLGRPCANDTFP
jgi:putative ABC transport system permease protein